MSREELNLPAKHLRACDISDNSKDLCLDQHANAFSETLIQTVHKDVDIGTKTMTMPQSAKGTGTMTDISGLIAGIGTRPVPNAGRNSRPVKLNTVKNKVISGKALKAWIIDKGFNGTTTQSQRDTPKDGKKLPNEKVTDFGESFMNTRDD